jgi:2-dehydropantoate 2-reductase
VRILVLGAGVIGSVYGGALLKSGHDVAFLARGSRLYELRAGGLVLEEAETGVREAVQVPVLDSLSDSDHFDVIFVAVRAEQLSDALQTLAGAKDASDVLIVGNTAGHQAELLAALGSRVMFGFPAVGGVRTQGVIRYVQITQQKTMLGEADGSMTPRIVAMQGALDGAGFPTMISADISAWLLAHAAFVVPIAYALYRMDVDPAKLAADSSVLRAMVLATRQAFVALRSDGNREIPGNLIALYLRLPSMFAVGYWRRVMSGPRGELWFGAHSRAAPEEMRAMADELQEALRGRGRPTPELDRLLAGNPG